MTNPEFGPVEESCTERAHAEKTVSELSAALDDVTFNMRLLARNSVLSNVDDYLPDEMARLRGAVTAARGLPIQGGVEVNAYFVPAEKIYKRGKLPFRRYGTNDFQGIIRGVGEVPTPTLTAGESVSRLCISVDPLYLLHDAALGQYYSQRGWVNQLRHPFAEEEHQDTTLCIPVDALSEKGVQLVDYWKTS